MSAAASNVARFLPDVDPPYCSMAVAPSFSLLTPKEKLYAHHLSRASWEGARIIMNQWTPFAERFYDFLILLLESEPGKIADMKGLQSKAKLDEAEWSQFLEYVSQALSNLCNYKNFGASKFIPRIPSESFQKVVEAVPNASEALPMWKDLSDYIYSLTPEPTLLIGKPSSGHISNYYLGEPITDDEVAMVQTAAENIGVDTMNTRLRKISSTEYSILVASATSKHTESRTVDVSESSGHKITLHLEYGDFSGPLTKVVCELRKARKYAANPHQEAMIDGYISSFESGSVEEHKKASTDWVQDVGPVVESYIGFIETYLDPFAARAEWEGFTAIVNKELSMKYEKLVAQAPELLKTLPWGPDFEVDEFKKPDFTALEILNFAAGGIPAGINIPNYYDVREQHGFKNVSLANILAAKAPNEEKTFIHPDDLAIYERWETESFNVQVANHELLGHGSGKEFKQNEDGSTNFVLDKIINPLTTKPVTTWYKPGQTAGSVLGTSYASFEECRAEAVGVYLCSNLEILRIFGITEREDVENIIFVTYLHMARQGLRALEFYDPGAKKHLQAHMQARMGILNFMIREGLARLEEVRGPNGVLENVYVRVDKNLVLASGADMIGKLVVALQVYKSTADGEGGRRFYLALTEPLAGGGSLDEIREVVLRKRQPRKIFVQPNTYLESGEVLLKEYALSAEGVIQSFIERSL